MSSGSSRRELEARVKALNRAVGRQAAFFDQAVADRLGLALADVACLDLISDAGPLTAGKLAELSGLTTGATTRMIDRLEQAGYVRRVSDAADRRRVLVAGVPERLQTVGALHDPLDGAQTREMAPFSDAELELIARFLERAISMLSDEARKLREPDAAGASNEGSFAAPLAGVTSARLVFLSGTPNLTVRADSAIRDLYRARFEGAVPRVRVRGNVVTVSYPKFGWFDWRTMIGGQNVEASVHWRKDRGELLLNAGVRWAVELRGGASKLSLDLRSADLASFEVRGGASRLDLELGMPSGVVPIRIAGGVNQLSVRRPAGAAIALTVRGGAKHVTLDGERALASGPLSLESPRGAGSRDRFDLEIAGGGNRIAVSRD